MSQRSNIRQKINNDKQISREIIDAIDYLHSKQQLIKPKTPLWKIFRQI